MKKNKNNFIILLIIFVIIIFILALSQNKINWSSIFQNQKAADKMQQTPVNKPTEPDFSFNIAGANIEAKDKSSGNIVQKIPLSEDMAYSLALPMYHNIPISDIVSVTDDINFDGYKDLQVTSVLGATNEAYNYYIYNPSTQKFGADKTLEYLFSPTFDAKNKTIKTYQSMGCAGEDFVSQIFSFVGGKYILTSTQNGNCCTLDERDANAGITVTELKNGKMEPAEKQPCPTR